MTPTPSPVKDLQSERTAYLTSWETARLQESPQYHLEIQWSEEQQETVPIAAQKLHNGRPYLL